MLGAIGLAIFVTFVTVIARLLTVTAGNNGAAWVRFDRAWGRGPLGAIAHTSLLFRKRMPLPADSDPWSKRSALHGLDRSIEVGAVR